MRIPSDEIIERLGVLLILIITLCVVYRIIQPNNKEPSKNIINDDKYIYHCTKEGVMYFEPKYDFYDQRKSLAPYYDQEGKIVKCDYHQTKLKEH